ncbi:hypothetical protein GFS24_17715 [Chitinophaga sp. SYP-B3965]|uniref:hypothetical protein n=1 Tax=Chitinophaga sp. SYP-B3965 TaxID=2663120 RepID=UPI001299D64A|nr:hypothetical protein [Chitinophaga sp. SYP-B3965]MRG46964.1 hypothetical protein [Chitinophaga sp. SYP-B3965]
MSSFQKKPYRRTVVYSKDVATYTGKSLRVSQRILADIRVAFGKHKCALVTVREFCLYWNISEEDWWDRMS